MDASGAKSQVAGITSAIVVMFVLLFLTPVFKNMPQNVQGAIVISAVLGLFNYSEWFFLWRVSDAFLACAFNVSPASEAQLGKTNSAGCLSNAEVQTVHGMSR